MGKCRRTQILHNTHHTQIDPATKHQLSKHVSLLPSSSVNSARQKNGLILDFAPIANSSVEIKAKGSVKVKFASTRGFEEVRSVPLQLPHVLVFTMLQMSMLQEEEEFFSIDVSCESPEACGK